MNFRRSLLLIASFLLVSYVHAGKDEINETDIQALREFINTKRQVTVKELGGALSVSGEVRAEFQQTNEKRGGAQQRGLYTPTGVFPRSFDIEVNLMLDYRTDRTWAAIKLEFDNAAGSLSGTEAGVDLERAYFGVRLIQGNSFTTDIEIGRRAMGQIFDSKIEFDSRFDGILFRFDQAVEKVGDFYAHVGTFVINERRDHFGYIGELGLLNIAGTGIYTKYSLVDWDTKDYKKPYESERFYFMVSQFILGYKFVPAKFQKVVLFYAAALVNHAARKLAISDHKKQNLGGYAGFSIGQLKKKGDWATDVNYQIVQAQAIADYDVSGIGTGNAIKSGFYTKNLNGTGGPNTRETAGGNTNYQGYSLGLEYLFTDNLLIAQVWVQSWNLNKDIGPDRKYHQYEIEFIYAF